MNAKNAEQSTGNLLPFVNLNKEKNMEYLTFLLILLVVSVVSVVTLYFQYKAARELAGRSAIEAQTLSVLVTELKLQLADTSQELLHSTNQTALLEAEKRELVLQVRRLKQESNKLVLTREKEIKKAVAVVEKRYLEHAGQWLDHLFGEMGNVQL